MPDLSGQVWPRSAASLLTRRRAGTTALREGLAASTWIPVSLPAVASESGQWGASDTEAVVPVSGLYLVTVAAAPVVGNGTRFIMRLNNLTTNVVLMRQEPYVSSSSPVFTVSTTEDVDAGDRLQFEVWCGAAWALNEVSSRFDLTYLGSPG